MKKIVDILWVRNFTKWLSVSKSLFYTSKLFQIGLLVHIFCTCCSPNDPQSVFVCADSFCRSAWPTSLPLPADDAAVAVERHSWRFPRKLRGGGDDPRERSKAAKRRILLSPRVDRYLSLLADDADVRGSCLWMLLEDVTLRPELILLQDSNIFAPFGVCFQSLLFSILIL